MSRVSKKAVSLMLVISVLTGLVCTGVNAADIHDGTAVMRVKALEKSGSDAIAGEAYAIQSDDDMTALSEYVNQGRATDGAIFYLERDIRLDNRDMQPIGTEEYPFNGIFDGHGFEIYEFSMDNSDTAALFGCVSGEIRNMGVFGTVSGNKAAGIAAVLRGRICNCWSNVKVTGNDLSGGIVAEAENGTIENCCFFGNSSGGGVAGNLKESSVVRNCYYTYYGAAAAVSYTSEDSAAEVYRFASSPTVCVAEKEIGIGSYIGEDVTELLNAWIGVKQSDTVYCQWYFDTRAAAAERVGGRYPAQIYPGYAFPEEAVYTANASMTTLYEMGTDAERGKCYSISDALELSLLADFVNEGHNTEGATFFLTADMSVISSDSHYKGESWIPIGDSIEHSFKGVFDGQGFVITELLINNIISKDAPDHAGLFGYVNSPDAVIKNTAVFGSVTGAEYAGGIVADLVSGTVENSWFDGIISAKQSAGGIAGEVLSGTLKNCVYFGTAECKRNCGGIAGKLYSTSEVSFCYYSNENGAATGSEDGNVYLVSDFNVSKGEYILSRSVRIADTSTVRLLNALNQWVDTFSADDSMRPWKHDTSAVSLSRIRSVHPTQIYFGEGKNAQYAAEVPQETERKDNPYNVYYHETSTMTDLYNSGEDAMKGGNYSISSGDEMWLLSMFVEEGHNTKGANFYLTGDIYITNQGIGHMGAGWVPIGTGISIDYGITSTNRFFGDFDGCGFTVYGLYVVSDFLDFVGLFGRCKGSTIKNLGVCGEILGDDEVGGIVGRIEDGEIINCWSSVSIQASTEIGGIAGHIVDSKVINCANYGLIVTTLDEHEDSGGIVGSSFGKCEIRNCYYLYNGSDSLGNSISEKTTVSDVQYFHYDIAGTHSCTLKTAVRVGDLTSDDLLTVLNEWVYAQNSDRYCTWHMAASIQEIPGANGYFPVLLNSTALPKPSDPDYCGDYEADAAVSELYGTGLNGVEGCCYSISDTDDLLAFRKYVNEGYKTDGIVFFLMRDINMGQVYSPDTGLSWTPVGTAQHPFRGTFDGQGYTLKYIYVSGIEDDQGFFGHVSGSRAVVKNLGITGQISGIGVNTAAICADFDFGTIANCWTACAVEGRSNVGGIIGGGNMGTVKNCANYGMVIGSSGYGAIAGFPVGTRLENCYYLYATCQSGYQIGSTPVAKGVSSFNGTGAVCVLEDKVRVDDIETKNALIALNAYVDAHPEENYCFWDVASTEEYYLMGVTGYPVLVSASGTLGEKDRKTVQAFFKGEAFYSVSEAVNAANASPGGGDVTLAVNAVLRDREDVGLDDDVTVCTLDHSLIINSDVCLGSMSQLNGTFIVKDGGAVYLRGDDPSDTRLFLYSSRNADESCNSEFFGTESLSFSSSPVKDNTSAYRLTLHTGEFKVNSALFSGNPHRIPGGSTLTVESKAALTVLPNARIRTAGGAEIFNYGNIKIGNVTLDRNMGARMKGVLDDKDGTVILPFIYRDGYTFRGWSDGVTVYPGGSSASFSDPCTLKALWNIGEGKDAYPGDDYYNDEDGIIYNIPITVIPSSGGSISPGCIEAARGETLSFSVKPDAGYYIKNVLLDGVSAAPDEKGQYKLISIGRPHTVTALFAPAFNLGYLNWENPFKDVTRSDWYYDNIRYVSSAGLFYGTAPTVFSPDETMTRDMVVTVLWRIAGCPSVPDSGAVFCDISKDSYAYDAVLWANHFGIVLGHGDGSFGCGEPVTREQLVTILYRFAKNYAGDDVAAFERVGILRYTDVLDISKGMIQPFEWGIGSGIINGTSDSTLSPGATATRAQVAAVISRYCNIYMIRSPLF